MKNLGIVLVIIEINKIMITFFYNLNDGTRHNHSKLKGLM